MNSMKYDMMAIAPGGGHFREILLALEDIDKSEVLFVTDPLPHLLKRSDLNVEFIVDPRLNPFKFGVNFFTSVYLVYKYRPSIIISAGGGISLPTFIFGKLLGAKTIFIESGCRIQFPSRTGRILYHFSDYFIIQSRELKKNYPKSILSGIL